MGGRTGPPRDGGGSDPRARTIDAIVFDLDGVLIDSEAVWDASRRAVTTENGGQWRAGATRAMMGMSSPEWSRYLHDELGVALDPDEIAARVVERMIASYRADLPVFPGATAAVQRLSKRWPLGLASSANRPVIDAALAGSGLAAHFAATVSSEEVPRGKPAPDVYLEAARRLDVEPGHAAAVEDSSNGLRAGEAAGMLVVALPNQAFPPDSDALGLADLVVDSLDALTPESILEAAARRPRLPLSARTRR
jgi:HAD superfamily hydrolase (TIGR01509 family)